MGVGSLVVEYIAGILHASKEVYGFAFLASFK